MQRSYLTRVLAGVALGWAFTPEPACGQTIEDLTRDLEAMKRQMRSMQETIERQDAVIRNLAARERPKTKKQPVATATSRATKAEADAARALDAAVAASSGPEPATQSAAAPTPTAPAARGAGGTTLRSIDVSVDTLVAAGGSTADDAEIAVLEGGAHDPKRRGFTLQQSELSLSGAVDPYFTGEAHVVFTDSSVELEEAFFTTQSLPYGFQVKGGYFLTEFGRQNPMHAHAWQWLDQPVIATRLFGPEGLRNPGVRVGWLAPLPWFSQVQLGVQNASGETAVSFLGEGGGGGHAHGDEEDEEHETGIGGRPVVERSVHDLGDLLYLTRWENGVGLTDTVTAKLGGSALFGPNASGAHGRTTIYGGDLVVKWRPDDSFRGWPFLAWESEIMGRNFAADAVPGDGDEPALPAATLHDWGLYSQLVYGFTYGWAAGFRYEYASGSGQSVGGRASDPLRDDRHRLSPLLSFRPTEFSRIRLQYNFDRAQFLQSGDASSVWLGVEILYGQHPAHNF